MSLTENAEATATPEDDHHEEIITLRGLKMIYAALALVVVLWGLAIYIWGVPGLYIPALCLVPVIYGLLIYIAKG
ncbi:hypothetical protein [Falsiphaeobacter marinintestinus]|uniref:hypothetical protein n=1 Tax=Falsiphaeobacter marinintestinus TaxID=1492905 RepID=UPI0011B60318|nr:hypothetical protein [Phaeobacter marinintestinus]